MNESFALNRRAFNILSAASFASLALPFSVKACSERYGYFDVYVRNRHIKEFVKVDRLDYSSIRRGRIAVNNPICHAVKELTRGSLLLFIYFDSYELKGLKLEKDKLNSFVVYDGNKDDKFKRFVDNMFAMKYDRLKPFSFNIEI